MRIFFNNQANQSAMTTSSASSSTTYFPWLNAFHPHRKLLWKTTGASSSENLTMQFSSAVAASCIVLIDHNFVGGETLTLKANTSNSWGSPAFSQALTITTGILAQSFSTQTYAWWRLEITKSSAGKIGQLGVFYLGTVYDTNDEPTSEGYSEAIVDPSSIVKSYGGQTFVGEQEKYTTFKVDFKYADQTFKDSLTTIYNAQGESRPFVAQVQPSGTLNRLVYARFTDTPSFQVTGFDASLRWNFNMQYEEQV